MQILLSKTAMAVQIKEVHPGQKFPQPVHQSPSV
jgi:hypothetical protein